MTNFHTKTLGDPVTPQNITYGFKRELSSSKKQYADFKETKSKIDEIVKLRSEKRFLGKREKYLDTAWRHGITGIEDTNYPQSTVYQ